MHIIEPSVELWKNINNVAHFARCAFVCYATEKIINYDKFRDKLINSEHLSMLRHESYYYIIPRYALYTNNYFDTIFSSPYCCVEYGHENIYLSTNGQYIHDNKLAREVLKNYRVSETEISQWEEGMNILRYTFCCITQISTSRELNRVSPNNIAEQSTRYVYDNGTLCRPWWFTISENNSCYSKSYNDTIITNYIKGCKEQFDNYKNLVELGMKKQDARGVLPLDTATKCVYTYSIKEWRNILDLRYYGTTGSPHPNAKIIAEIIRQLLIDLGYEFR